MMKQSGVEWIGEIPEGWEINKVSTFYNVVLGKMLQPKKEFENDTYENYLCAANVGNNSIKLNNYKQMWFSEKDKLQYDVKKGDLIVVEGGDVASCDIIKDDVENLYIQNALHRVRSKNNFSLSFLKYWLIMAKGQNYISLLCNKATIAHFTKEKLMELPIAVLSVDEQESIAAFLDSQTTKIDALIANEEAQIEKLKSYRQSLITETVTKGLNKNAKTKDSGVEWIGQIPEGWECRKLKYVATSFAKGTGITKEDIVENGDVPCVRYGEIYTKYNIKFEKCETRTNLGLNPTPQYFSYGDILFTCTGELVEEIGKSIVYLGNEECLAGGDIVVMKHSQNPKFMGYALDSWYAQEQKSRGKAKLKVVHTSAGALGNIYILLPPKAEQESIASFLDTKCEQIDRLISIKESKIQKLEAYKKSLIYEYVTGKKQVQILQNYDKI